VAEEYRFGNIVLVEYPFSDGIREKLRPALVISSQNDGDILLARITSQFPKTPRDIPLTDWKASNLMLASTVRLEKLTNILTKRVDAKIGKLSDRDRKQIIAGLRAFIDGLESAD
jgi:mRNA interferase MazF